MKEIFAWSAGILALIAGVPYIVDVVRRKTKPNIVTWVTWSILTTIVTIAAFAAHQPRTAYLTLGDTLANVSTVILGLKYGIAKFTWVDGVCLAGVAVALALWTLFNSPVVAIVAVVIVDCIASVALLHHSWLKPEEETWQTFLFLCIASILTLLSLNSFTVASLSFPTYLLFANGAVVAVVVYRRKQLGLELGR